MFTIAKYGWTNLGELKWSQNGKCENKYYI